MFVNARIFGVGAARVESRTFIDRTEGGKTTNWKITSRFIWDHLCFLTTFRSRVEEEIAYARTYRAIASFSARAKYPRSGGSISGKVISHGRFTRDACTQRSPPPPEARRGCCHPLFRFPIFPCDIQSDDYLLAMDCTRLRNDREKLPPRDSRTFNTLFSTWQARFVPAINSRERPSHGLETLSWNFDLGLVETKQATTRIARASCWQAVSDCYSNDRLRQLVSRLP